MLLIINILIASLSIYSKGVEECYEDLLFVYAFMGRLREAAWLSW
jgi:hypothetical protein